MRRVMRRYEEHAMQMKTVGGGAGHCQMSIVDWIERAAEERDSTSAQSSPN
jgi:hypothetical protein